MHVQVHYQNVKNSPWMDQFILGRIERLHKFLSPSGSIQVNIKHMKNLYLTNLVIHNPHHDFAFTTEAENLYESFQSAIEKAARSLNEQKRKLKDRMNKDYFSIHDENVST